MNSNKRYFIKNPHRANKRRFPNSPDREESESEKHKKEAKRPKTQRVPHSIQTKGLTQILAMEVDNAIMNLERQSDNLIATISQKKIPKTDLELLINIMGQKLSSESDLNEIRNQLIISILEREFLEKLEMFTFRMQIEKDETSLSIESCSTENHSPTFVLLKDLHDFYSYVSSTMPKIAEDRLHANVTALKMTISNLKGTVKSAPTLSAFEMLENQVIKLEKYLQEEKLAFEGKMELQVGNYSNNRKSKMSDADIEYLYMGRPPQDFRKMSITPTTSELTVEGAPYLRPNLVKGKYPSADVYLDVQFRLLREDFVAPLRNSISEYLKSRSDANYKMRNSAVRLYKNVKIVSLQFDTGLTVYTLQLEVSKFFKNIKWETSKRFLPGSLLCLTTDNFDSIYFACIVHRKIEELRKGLIKVTWEGSSRPTINLETNYLMIECEVYFEAYRHTLRTLQEIRLDEWPIKKYITGEKKEISLPNYLLPEEHYKIISNQSINFARSPSTALMPPISPSYYPTSPNYCPSSPSYSPFFEPAIPVNKASADNVPSSSNAVGGYMAGCSTKLQEDDSENNGTEIQDQETVPKLKPIESRGIKAILAQQGGQKEPFIQPQFLIFDELRNKEIENEWDNDMDTIELEEGEVKEKQTSSKTMKIKVSEILNFSSWPTAAQLGLDNSQYLAFRGAITNELTIIQGPPGTGKTFIGLEIVKFALKNRHIYDKNAPILVVCYTNHALDQFLEGIIQIADRLNLPKRKIIRIGSRTKSDKLLEYSIQARMHDARTHRQFDHDYAVTRNSLMAQLRDQQIRRSELINELRELNKLEGIINFGRLAIKPYYISRNYPAFLRCIIYHIVSTYNDIMNMRPCRDVNIMRFLGLHHEYFSSNRFSCQWFLKRWFSMTNHTGYSRVVNQAFENNFMVTATVPEDTENNEYNIDELVEHRMEINFEIESWTNRDDQTNRQEFNAHSMYVLSPWTHHGKLASIGHEAEKTALHNKQYFLQQFFGALASGRLYLPPFTEALLDKAESINDPDFNHLNYPERWAIYLHLIDQVKMSYFDVISRTEKSITDLQKKVRNINQRGEGILLKQAAFVGMTTTGAAKYNTLLPMMKSPIVIVEEAGEVLESHIVTCLTKDCQHLILIGDHKQLRPSTNAYELSKQYNMDVSLFERMIINGINYFQLEVQHRMRPSICKLLVPTIYETLENHSSVYDYPDIRGVTKNLFFITHTEPEKMENDSETKSNVHEGKFLMKLSRYLILQGYLPTQITILTTYLGQMFLMKKLQKEEGEICANVRITVVDNYQGEENEIILLSLVRSNQENKIGFLATENRICVAISRAKHGMFIIGNMEAMLGSKSITWKKINSDLEENGNIGKQLELKCQIHGQSTFVSQGEDFDKIPEGGCSQMCNTVLKCGHICRLMCHSTDRLHEEYQCRKPCNRKCENDHPCKLFCSRDCGSCNVKMSLKLPCDHTIRIVCAEIDTKPDCQENVIKELPCGHKQKAKCYESVEKIQCTTLICVEMPICHHSVEIMCQNHNKPELWKCDSKCDIRLDCGHTCGGICHAKENPDHENFECTKLCRRYCELRHSCESKHSCSTKCPPCYVKVVKQLPCGHRGRLQCKTDEKLIKCKESCSKTPSCGHKCKRKCFEKCFCEVIVKTRSEDCGHEIEIYCGFIANKDYKPQCKTKIKSPVKSACGHDVLIPCWMEKTVTPESCLEYCQTPCNEVWDIADEKYCGHSCNGNCFPCFQGRIHIKCNAKCDRVLACGHICKFPCASRCLPCQERCESKCDHSKCRKLCGTPCEDCKERCSWKCPHKRCSQLCGDRCDRKPCDVPCKNILRCGHKCIGLCGEPCPPVCKLCHKEKYDELTEVFFGYEDEPNVRFIWLKECGHIFESKGLDLYMKSEAVKNSVLPKGCPRCKTIINCPRYRKIFHDRMKDITAVKRRIYGQERKFKDELKKLILPLKVVSNDRCFLDFRNFLQKETYTVKVTRWSGYEPIVEPKPMDQYMFETIDNMMTWYLDGKETVKKIMHSHSLKKSSIVLSYEALFNNLKERSLPLSKREILDFRLEFERLGDEVKLFRRSLVEGFETIPGASNFFSQIENLMLNKYGKYTASVQDKFMTDLKELDCLIKKQIENWKEEEVKARDRKSIFEATGFGANHWYKCPNGHYYIIADCGRPRETSRCPECKSTIGAASYHVLAIGNSNADPNDLNASNVPSTSNILKTNEFLN